MLLDYLTKRPLLLLAVLAVPLCISGYYFKLSAFIFILFFLVLFAVLLFFKVSFKYIFIVVMLFLTSVSIAFTNKNADRAIAFDGEIMTGEFVVTEKPVDKGIYYAVNLEANGCKELKDGTKIIAYYNRGLLKIGDRISATVKLSRIENYKAGYYAEKTYLSGGIKEYSVLKDKEDRVLSLVGRLRKYISGTLFKYMKYDRAATLTAIVFGDMSYLSDEFYANSKAAGVTHAMVVSGMHLTVIVALVTGISDRLFYNRFSKCLTVFLTVLFMVFLCGFTKSVVRAGVCYLIYGLSVLNGRDNNSVNTLGGAVGFILLFEPFSVFSVSFQLSVLSTFGIVAVAVPVNRFLELKKPFRLKIILDGFCSANITLAATVFTMPVAIYIFGYLSTVSVFSNLLISFAVTAALCMAAVALVLYPILPILAVPLLFITELIVAYINFIINSFGSLPSSTVTVGKYGVIPAVILILLLIFALFACKKRQDMLKLNLMDKKIKAEGGGRLKWR